MDQEQLLSYYGKEIIRTINPNLIDRLSCDICSLDFNDTNKKPIKMCLNNHQTLGVCLQCYQIQSRKAQPKCHLCRSPMLTPFSDDFDRQEKVKARDHLLKKLSQLSRNTKEMTKAQSDKKLKEIIQRAEKDMGKSTEQSKKKAMQVERLRIRLKRMMQNEEQKERAALDLSRREEELFQREKQHKETMQEYMKERMLLKSQLMDRDELIKKLKQQNRSLKLRLNDNTQIEQLQERVVRKRRAEFPIYNDNFYFRSFKFNPERIQSFLEYFIESKDSKMIQLNQSKELEFRGNGTRRMLFHSQVFNAKNEEDRLFCFKIKSHNKRVPVYKFGICDEQNKEYKDAYISLFLKHDQTYEFPYQITFYVNLVNKKLYATSVKENNSKQLPPTLHLSKFKIYLYFSDIKTQLTFHK